MTSECGCDPGGKRMEVQLLRPEGDRLMRKAPRSIPGRPRLYTLDIHRIQEFKAD